MMRKDGANSAAATLGKYANPEVLAALVERLRATMTADDLPMLSSINRRGFGYLTSRLGRVWRR